MLKPAERKSQARPRPSRFLCHPNTSRSSWRWTVHAASIVVVRMVDGAKPQPPQGFKPADFLEWARKQKALAKEVVSCYEAGALGDDAGRSSVAERIATRVRFEATV